MLLQGIGISGYRSFWGEPIRIGPCKKVNFIIGKNNSGKSNILEFLRNNLNVLNNIVTQEKVDTFFKNEYDPPLKGEPKKITLEIGVNRNCPKFREQIVKCRPNPSESERTVKLVDTLLSNSSLTDDGGLVWVRFTGAPASIKIDRDQTRRFSNANALDQNEWYNICNYISGLAPTEIQQQILTTLSQLARFSTSSIPPVLFIPAIRQVGAKGSKENIGDCSGLGIIEKINRLQSPIARNYTSDKQKYETINNLLKEVVRNQSARIEIPHELDTINVELDGKLLPLTSLGTGIHELIIIAAYAAIEENKIICIEEPEIHLHPELQRQLIQYLVGNTNNQYFIATHSTHMLDVSDSAIFHIKDIHGRSEVNAAINDIDRKALCDDIGYRASDILQANSIIWVEGPSDRIYLNKWLTKVDPTLIEGVHYSVMFYGGRLLAHLSASFDPDEDAIKHFIDLGKLNQNMSIIIDSDKENDTDDINETKERLRDEIVKRGGVAWITAGRTVENYIKHHSLKKTICEKYKINDDEIELNTGDFANVTKYRIKGTQKEINKVSIACLITAHDVSLDILDLKLQTEELVKFIWKANGKVDDEAEQTTKDVQPPNTAP